ncbi:MAG TPA: class I SAM-dependent methyltransferase [Polyangiaceae bacterium]|nr:class I SAM-dependent methyltransferase [Polyangiaceae bacterium]
MTNEHDRAAEHRERFGDLVFDADDLLLLEPFQIRYLEGRVPLADFGELLRAHRHVGRYLRRACPAVAPWLQQTLDAEPPGASLEECEQRVLWEIADLIVYNKAPHAYDALPHHRWDFEAVTSVAALAGTVALDVGAGTGQTAVELSRRARTVFAIEPVGRLRQFVRDRAQRRKRGNLYVIDGMAHAIPLPSQFADVIVCVRSLRNRGNAVGVGGWRLDDEVAELERVVRPGGTIVICSGWLHDEAADRPEHQTLTSPRWGYRHDAYAGYVGQLSRYHKQC